MLPGLGGISGSHKATCSTVLSLEDQGGASLLPIIADLPGKASVTAQLQDSLGKVEANGAILDSNCRIYLDKDAPARWSRHRSTKALLLLARRRGVGKFRRIVRAITFRRLI